MVTARIGDASRRTKVVKYGYYSQNANIRWTMQVFCGGQKVLKVIEYRCCCHVIIHAFVFVYAVPRATQLFPSSRSFLTILFN